MLEIQNLQEEQGEGWRQAGPAYIAMGFELGPTKEVFEEF